MATRANVDLNGAVVKTYKVKASSIVTLGFPVKIDTNEEVVNCSAGDAADGIARESGTAGNLVEVAVANCGGVVAVKVGTGGATAGLYGVAVANGAANSGTLGGGSVLTNLVCKFLQTGVAGDLVGAVPLSIPAVKA